MKTIAEYQNFVVLLKSYCQRDMHINNIAYTDYIRGFNDGRKDLNEHILHLIDLLDSDFYDCEKEDEDEDW